MKKSVIAILLASVMVLFCACGSTGAEKLPVPETPEGWEVYEDGALHLFYPSGEYEDSSVVGVDFQVTDPDTGASMNVVSSVAGLTGIEDIDEAYVQNIIDECVAGLDPVYESQLGVECDTTGTFGKVEMKNFGNGKCAAFSYAINIYIPDYDMTLVTQYYQVLYVKNVASAYAVTFACITEDNTTAEEYFADEIGMLFFE